MNRTIKFRGIEQLHTTPPQWIYGSLIVTPDGGTFIRKDNGETYPVDPDTVGQFTGLCDKNGNEIYEGDILCYTDENQITYYREVIYVDACFAFSARIGEKTFWSQLNRLFLDSWQISGNIHDNPELMEGGVK